MLSQIRWKGILPFLLSKQEENRALRANAFFWKSDFVDFVKMLALICLLCLLFGKLKLQNLVLKSNCGNSVHYTCWSDAFKWQVNLLFWRKFSLCRPGWVILQVCATNGDRSYFNGHFLKTKWGCTFPISCETVWFLKLVIHETQVICKTPVDLIYM